MAVSGTSSSTSTSSSSSSSSSSTSTIAGNFDQFLQLLTTQLKNQSPLDPLDTNQFTEQLVQFAGVEQQLKTNETLSALLQLNAASTVNSAVSFVGATVTADGAATQLKDGVANWKINVPSSGSATITIKDKNGNVMKTDSITLSSGDQTYTWDGKTSTGSNAANGEYTITVDAKNASNEAITAKTEISGVVDSIDVSGSVPMLRIGSITIALDKVKTVTRASE